MLPVSTLKNLESFSACYYHNLLVPTAPPDEISATDKTDTTITVGWREIFLPERHGIITKYELTYQKTEARSKRDAEIKTMTFDSGTFTAFLFMLTPYTNYTITIAGLTSKGIGPKGVKIIETAEGSKERSPLISLDMVGCGQGMYGDILLEPAFQGFVRVNPRLKFNMLF